MPWEREAFSTLAADPAQLDGAFMAANGAALDAKLSQYSAAQRDELLGKKSDLEVLGMSAKDLDKFFNPPPPKVKKVKEVQKVKEEVVEHEVAEETSKEASPVDLAPREPLEQLSLIHI